MIRSSALLPCVVIAAFCLALCWASDAAHSGTDANAPKAIIPPHFDLGKDKFVVFITGNTLGELRPCGCTGGQLGGFDRRASVINAVDPNRRVVIDTGNILEKTDVESLIKFDTIMQAFALCNYDVVNLTPADAEIAKRKDYIGNTPFSFISATGPDLSDNFKIRKRVNGRDLQFNVISIANSTPHIELAVGEGIINVLILDSEDSPEIDWLARYSTVVVVRAEDTDTPKLLRTTQSGGLIVTAGRKGKYVGMLEVTVPAEANAPLKLAYREIGLVETLPQDKAVLDLYKDYQATVKKENLLEKYPRYRLPDKIEYIGSKACGRTDCHPDQYSKWLTVKHSQAHQQLVDVGYDYDPECQICHSTGMEYKSGFVSPDKTPQFENVGCENCHGPGSKHMLYSKIVKMPLPKPQDRCKNCHTLEQGPKMWGHEQEYLDKIKHWKEPNSPAGVKK